MLSGVLSCQLHSVEEACRGRCRSVTGAGFHPGGFSVSCGLPGSCHQSHSLFPDAEQVQAPSAPCRAARPHTTQCLQSVPGAITGPAPQVLPGLPLLSQQHIHSEQHSAPPRSAGSAGLWPRARRAGNGRWTETYFCCRDPTGGFHAPIPGPQLSCPHSNHRAWRGRRGTVVRGRHGASRG